MQPLITIIKNFLDSSLKEDLGINGDITSNIVIDKNSKVKFQIQAREDLILCGDFITIYYLENYSKVNFKMHYKDGDIVYAGAVILTGEGNAQEIFKLERIILNFMQYMSGIASLTNKYVNAVIGTKAKIYDTRKTLPMWRMLQKYAVRCGKGYNHRPTLDSCIMIKDNHIATTGLSEAVRRAKQYAPHYAKIEVECDTLEQVKEALLVGVDIIMLDNMTLLQMKEAVNVINGRAIIEASGGISLENVQEIAEIGVDIISIGKLTHSANSVNIGLDIL
ncbi:MAG: carboxylating nicotinate-nucleotide diphosphorylase [Rickettsiaceae bacterium]|nr:carboxylating nicotinate-nucleotide diphosphorylase [Rickettsiaceae bacterium]